MIAARAFEVPMRSVLVILAFLAACEPPPPPTPGAMERTGEVLTVVNGQNVTQGMLDATLKDLPANARDQIVARGQMGQVKEQLVVGELLYQEALKQNLHQKPDVKNTIALAERKALAQALLQSVVEQRADDAAVKAWYDEHAVQFARPQVKARHILVKDEGLARELLAQVKGGGDFARIAIEKSEDKGSGKEGGELGWFDKGRMVTEFADAAFAANKGDIVGPVKTRFGFHIIEIEDKRESVPLEEAAEKIKPQLSNEIVQNYVDELKKSATMSTPGAAAPAPGATVAPAAVETEAKPTAAVGGGQ
jgi:peptidyl-prolyl cis-trans isomerase C